MDENFYTLFLLRVIHVMVEKELFSGQIFEMEVLINLHDMTTPESENHIFNVWFVCVCVSCVCFCVRAYVSVISITQKQITAETPKFGILHLYHI